MINMSGSVFGKCFTVSTWGESHGKALGAVIDGCPAGIEINEEYIQSFMDRRKPGSSRYATKRVESDKIEILSGVFEGVTTGAPVSLILYNESQRSHDYSDIAHVYRPGHADYTYDVKYGIRDYRGGGRSSGRETAARVAAGAVAIKALSLLGISFLTYVSDVGDISCDEKNFDKKFINQNELYMPDRAAYEKARAYLDEVASKGDSSGAAVKCIVTGVPAGIGDPCFDKLDARIAGALMSIGAVKAVEIGNGIEASRSRGSINNDGFYAEDGKVFKKTNNAGGITGGISDGSDIVIKAHFKPTPSIYSEQQTVNSDKENVSINIKGRHDPIIAPRAAVVVESMTALSILDLLLCGMGSKMENVLKVYNN